MPRGRPRLFQERLQVLITDDQREALERMARAEDCGVSILIRKLIGRAIEDYEPGRRVREERIRELVRLLGAA